MLQFLADSYSCHARKHLVMIKHGAGLKKDPALGGMTFFFHEPLHPTEAVTNLIICNRR
jgi:hypothetical protein